MVVNTVSVLLFFECIEKLITCGEKNGIPADLVLILQGHDEFSVPLDPADV